MNTDTRDPKTYDILGAAMEVHNGLGHGFLEAVYQSALAVEFATRKIPYRREAPMDIIYRGKPLDVKYRVDFLCFDSVLVELKAISGLASRDEGQVINYLTATGLRRALLINFGLPKLEYKRLAY